MGLQTVLNATRPATGPRDAAQDAVTALLTAATGTAQTVVADAVLVAPDARTVDQAQRHLTAAHDQWRKGHPVATVEHLRKAVDRAADVLRDAGVSYDDSADADGNGLPDVVELAFGADPRVADTDGDGLDDAAEVDDHGTDPVATDGDEDGLDDAGEVRAGTDPFDPDSDDDGVLDGDDLVTGVVARPDGTRVTLTGVGDLAGTLEISPWDAGTDPPGMVGGAVDLTVAPDRQDAVVAAEITLPYDDAAAPGDEADLRIFWFDEERRLWVPAAHDDQQQVDPAADTVTATVDHLSVYAIFDIRNWNRSWTAIGGTCTRRTGGDGSDVVFVDVALTLDSSGSMGWNDPQGLRRSAAKNFVDALLPEDRAAVVDFDSWARVTQPLTTDKDAVKTAIDRVDSWGGTHIGRGVDTALDELEANDEPGRAQVVILLTDGQGSYSTSLTERAAADGVTIYTIGLGPGVSAPLLRSIAEGTGGTYYPVATADDLPDVFRRIEEDQGDTGADTDGDGLTDCTEEQGVRSSSHGPATSNPQVVDTDGDGVDDGEEAGDPYAVFDPTWSYPVGSLYPLWSDPGKADTDGDGLTDPAEYDFGSDPWVRISDLDGLFDSEERDHNTDPRRIDTDGDGFRDDFEVDNADQGFHPLFFDERISRWRYVGDFVIGAVAGDAVRLHRRRPAATEQGTHGLAGAVASGGRLDRPARRHWAPGLPQRLAGR